MLQFLINRLKRVERIIAEPARREAVDAWSLLIGHDAAELWLEALSTRTTIRPTHA
jgi:hypothetical protein